MKHNKRIIIMNGGLGNQMFQYAFALALRNKGYHVKIDTSLYNYAKMHNGYELGRVFGINEEIICRKGLYLLWLRFLMKGFAPLLVNTDKTYINQQVETVPNRYLFGYWQSEKYFSDIEQIIRKVFAFRNIDERNLYLSREINNCEAVCIHIRRGDYESHGMTILGFDYYRQSVSKICEHLKSPIFYVFSDDMIAARSIMDSLNVKYRIVSLNHGDSSYKDMFLMSQCKHNIIANSSFSWWGAWLGCNPSKLVIAPSVWDEKKKLFHPQPDNWILI